MDTNITSAPLHIGPPSNNGKFLHGATTRNMNPSLNHGDPDRLPWIPFMTMTSPPLHSYVQTRSSFQGSTAVNATGFVRNPLATHSPLSTRPLVIGLDSYSDVTVAHRDIVYNVRPIYEYLSTGGGDTEYHEEGLVDIIDGPLSFRNVPALVASTPAHLPHKCLM